MQQNDSLADGGYLRSLSMVSTAAPSGRQSSSKPSGLPSSLPIGGRAVLAGHAPAERLICGYFGGLYCRF